MNYPKPKKTGGVLIRRVVTVLRQGGFHSEFLKERGPVYVACSGGPDSVALLHLLAKYGRRAVPFECLRALHINHHLRGDESLKDEFFVRGLCDGLGVPSEYKDVQVQTGKGKSLENEARNERAKVFSKYPLVLTAHQRDDVAETVLWRFFTGAPKHMTNEGGIKPTYKNQVRPFLGCWRSEILEYLKEERVPYRTDATNLEGKLLRSKIRTKLVPVLDEVFLGWQTKITEVKKL